MKEIIEEERSLCVENWKLDEVKSFNINDRNHLILASNKNSANEVKPQNDGSKRSEKKESSRHHVQKMLLLKLNENVKTTIDEERKK